jgi:hypothetical protein
MAGIGFNSSVRQGAQMPVKRVGQPAQQLVNAVDPAGLFMEFDATVFGNQQMYALPHGVTPTRSDGRRVN